MVGSATSLGRNGIHDWLLQRVSAIVLGLYTICIVSFIWLNPDMSFQTWRDYMTHPAMRIFSLIALLFVVVHAWIGLWTVATDYVKPTVLRLPFQVAVMVTCLILFVWGAMILWGM